MNSTQLTASFTEACINTNTVAELEAVLVDFDAGDMTDCEGDIDEWTLEVEEMVEDKDAELGFILTKITVSMSRDQWYRAITEARDDLAA